MKQEKNTKYIQELNEFLEYELTDIEKSPEGKQFKLKTNSSIETDTINIDVKNTDGTYKVTISSTNLSRDILKELLELVI